MITGHSFLVFAPGPWRDMWRNRHQIMSRLARCNTVLWVEPRRSLQGTLRARWDGLRWAPGVEHVGEGLHVFHNPATLPASGPLGLARLTSILHRTLVRRAMNRLGMDRPILWLYNPELAAIIGRYGERLVVYHVVDEYAAYGGIPAAYVPALQRWEQRLLRQAGVTIVTAPALLQSKSRHSANVHLVPNAVDYDGFQRRLAQGGIPGAIRGLPRPVIGYIGAINDKLDYGLLAALARSRPDWALALVGPVDVRLAEDVAGIAALRALPNVCLLGQVSVEDVPLYMAACDVCLLPYKINERTRNISALKLYEYLACGKPVVSTDVPAALEGQGLVRVAADQDFIAAVAESLVADHASAVQRQRVAAANTWDNRVDQISQILARYL